MYKVPKTKSNTFSYNSFPHSRVIPRFISRVISRQPPLLDVLGDLGMTVLVLLTGGGDVDVHVAVLVLGLHGRPYPSGGASSSIQADPDSVFMGQRTCIL